MANFSSQLDLFIEPEERDRLSLSVLNIDFY
jgi:hypothetical protein